jgi:glycosyltransferase involved in cell wall biosynthesis
MSTNADPTISVVVAAYQSERWIGDAVSAILAQTRPADEVIVVDDGSTDGTARELARFGDSIRVIHRENGGCPAAFNTAFAAASGDFVAMCGADDIWEPHKLEWQSETIASHPEVDVLFGDAELFGRVEGRHARPPATGVLDSDELRRVLFGENVVCAPSVVIRRELFERLGPFVEDFGADDYEYWMRCLRAGAQFYYDPRVLLRYRMHDSNLSARRHWMRLCTYEVRRRYAGDVGERRFVGQLLATDLFKIGRHLVDDGRPREARRAFRAALRYAPAAHPEANARALAWLAVLSLPDEVRSRAGHALVAATQAVDKLRGGRHPALP